MLSAQASAVYHFAILGIFQYCETLKSKLADINKLLLIQDH